MSIRRDRAGRSMSHAGGSVALHRALRRMRAVIDRDEVLHVARLARLQLSEDELEPMARELSAVLDHIATISELDLEDVRRRHTSSLMRCPPNPACARMSRARAFRARSRSHRRRLSAMTAFSSQVRKHERGDLDLSAAQAIAAIEAGELSAQELFAFYRGRAVEHGGDVGSAASTASRGRRRAFRRCARRPARRACRSPSRTCSAPRACRASRARGSSRATVRRTRRHRSRA